MNTVFKSRSESDSSVKASASGSLALIFAGLAVVVALPPLVMAVVQLRAWHQRRNQHRYGVQDFELEVGLPAVS